MKIEQKIWNKETGWISDSKQALGSDATLVLAFGPVSIVSRQDVFDELKINYPKADIVLSSATATIFNSQLPEENSLVVTALQFEKTAIQSIQINIEDVKDSFDVGMHISANLDKDNIKGLLVFSDTLPLINASHLVTGIHFNLSEHIPITGGLASSQKGEKPILGLNSLPKSGNVIGIGLSGDHIKIGHGMDAGWTPFGTERFVTRSENNIVYQLDHLTPFALYQQYLEGLVDDVAEAARQFPLGIKIGNSEKRLVRSVLSVDKETGSITCAGDVPEGLKVRMMKTNISNLIDSAGAAAKNSCDEFEIENPDFSLLVNCLGRQSILKHWAQEEIDAISASLGSDIPIMGFYSLGEIAPLKPSQKSELLNQTIVITSLKEI